MIELFRNEKHMNKSWRKLGENFNLLKKIITKDIIILQVLGSGKLEVLT